MLKGRLGFTLIELLVVIAIVAILAAILFPTFIRVKASAQKSTCASHLKQIGVGLSLYCDDNGGKYPYTLACGVDSGGYAGRPPDLPSTATISGGSPLVPGLAWTLRNHVKNARIWMCPAGANVGIVTQGPRAGYPDATYTVPAGVAYPSGVAFPVAGWVYVKGGIAIQTNYGSWALNRGLNSGSPDCGNGKTPTELYNTWLPDILKNYPWQASICGRILWDSYSPVSGTKPSFFAHKAGCNVLFYDGRVRFCDDGRSSSNYR